MQETNHTGTEEDNMGHATDTMQMVVTSLGYCSWVSQQRGKKVSQSEERNLYGINLYEHAPKSCRVSLLTTKLNWHKLKIETGKLFFLTETDSDNILSYQRTIYCDLRLCFLLSVKFCILYLDIFFLFH